MDSTKLLRELKRTANFTGMSVVTIHFWILFSMALACNLGCDESRRAEAVGPPIEKPANIDLGIVFSNESNYTCIPLERFGLERPDDVLSVTSTCDCIRPQLVEYLSTEKSHAWAVLLEYKREESSKNSSDSDRGPAKLGVVIELKLSGARSHSLTVRLGQGQEDLVVGGGEARLLQLGSKDSPQLPGGVEQ